MFKENVTIAMKEVFQEIPFGIEHTLKVLQNAEDIMKGVGYNKNIDRICFIIGNHHTPSKIDGIDFQIQWEADLLENLTVMDKEKEQEKIKKCIDENFKTDIGKKIAFDRFILFR